MSKRLCRKCGDKIPWRATIDGSVHNLMGRKFCLNCSPFKCNNTKKDDPDRPTVRKSEYKNWTQDQKRLHSARVKYRGIERKTKLIEMSGGKCITCGYDKCVRCLSFHHREPEKKLFCLSVNELWSRKWEVILSEWQKCDLLCIRCHLELEDKKNDFEYWKLDVERSRKVGRETYTKKCKQCNDEFITIDFDQLYCQTSCFNLKNRKVVRPSKEELELEIKTTNLSAAGRKYGVSDNCIRKWAKQYKILSIVN